MNASNVPSFSAGQCILMLELFIVYCGICLYWLTMAVYSERLNGSPSFLCSSGWIFFFSSLFITLHASLYLILINGPFCLLVMWYASVPLFIFLLMLTMLSLLIGNDIRWRQPAIIQSKLVMTIYADIPAWIALPDKPITKRRRRKCYLLIIYFPRPKFSVESNIYKGKIWLSLNEGRWTRERDWTSCLVFFFLYGQ